MPQTILLVRHAQTDFHRDRLAGWTPGVGLSEEGRRQAKALAERLGSVPLVAAYSSPLERCRETAEPVLEGRPLELVIEKRLGEVQYGSWQGKRYATLAKTKLWRTVQLVPSQATFPGGESLRELQRRAVEAVEEIRTRHPRGVVAVFSHADTIKVLAAHYLGMHLDLYQRIVIANASVTAIAFGMGVPRLLRLSDTGSYEELAPARRARKRR